MKQTHNHPTRGTVRRILSLTLMLTTLFMLTVFVPPVNALSAGDILYLKAEGQVIESAAVVFYDAEGASIGDSLGEVMSDEDQDGIFSIEILDGAVQLLFITINFEDETFVPGYKYTKIDLPQNSENTYDVVSGEWSVFGSHPTPDEPDSDPTETTGSTSYTDQPGQNVATITPSGEVGTTSAPAEIVAVDLTWEDMEFTYTPANQGVWDPEQHMYVDTTEASWTSDTNKITVTNHSNVDITVSFDFDSAQGLNLEGEFRDDSNEPVQSVDLPTAENPMGGVGEATTETVTFHITDGEITERTPVLGTITLTIEKKSE